MWVSTYAQYKSKQNKKTNKKFSLHKSKFDFIVISRKYYKMKLRTLRWAVPVTLTGSTGVWIWANMHREFMTNFYLEQPYVKEPVEKILVKHKGAKIVLGLDIKKAEPSMEMSFYVC